jgi:hypothetical protein
MTRRKRIVNVREKPIPSSRVWPTNIKPPSKKASAVLPTKRKKSPR